MRFLIRQMPENGAHGQKCNMWPLRLRTLLVPGPGRNSPTAACPSPMCSRRMPCLARQRGVRFGRPELLSLFRSFCAWNIGEWQRFLLKAASPIPRKGPFEPTPARSEGWQDSAFDASISGHAGLFRRGSCRALSNKTLTGHWHRRRAVPAVVPAPAARGALKALRVGPWVQ